MTDSSFISELTGALIIVAILITGPVLTEIIRTIKYNRNLRRKKKCRN